jgi:hypothetical protein
MRPSSVDVRCDRAWAYRYKLRPAEIAWPDIESGAVPLMKYGALPQPGECTFSQRSFARGKAFHDVAALVYAQFRGAQENAQVSAPWERIP